MHNESDAESQRPPELEGAYSFDRVSEDGKAERIAVRDKHGNILNEISDDEAMSAFGRDPGQKQEPVEATYTSQGKEHPVIVTGAYDEAKDGEQYMKIAGSDTAVPRDQLQWKRPEAAQPSENVELVQVMDEGRMEQGWKKLKTEGPLVVVEAPDGRTKKVPVAKLENWQLAPAETTDIKWPRQVVPAETNEEKTEVEKLKEQVEALTAQVDAMQNTIEDLERINKERYERIIELLEGRSDIQTPGAAAPESAQTAETTPPPEAGARTELEPASEPEALPNGASGDATPPEETTITPEIDNRRPRLLDQIWVQNGDGVWEGDWSVESFEDIDGTPSIKLRRSFSHDYQYMSLEQWRAQNPPQPDKENPLRNLFRKRTWKNMLDVIKGCTAEAEVNDEAAGEPPENDSDPARRRRRWFRWPLGSLTLRFSVVVEDVTIKNAKVERVEVGRVENVSS